jgi:CO dehydrogenase/acetyl-CoA synthase epsilon subunit
MSALHPTPPDRMVDAQGRPYFLWDVDMTLEAFQQRLVDADPVIRAHFLAKLMRQARPDDVLLMVGTRALREAWTDVADQLGHTRAFWAWWLAATAADGEKQTR